MYETEKVLTFVLLEFFYHVLRLFSLQTKPARIRSAFNLEIPLLKIEPEKITRADSDAYIRMPFLI